MFTIYFCVQNYIIFDLVTKNAMQLIKKESPYKVTNSCSFVVFLGKGIMSGKTASSVHFVDLLFKEAVSGP